MRASRQIAPLLAFLLAGCSSHLLEEVGEIPLPRDCAETTKAFGTFSMRARSTSWKGAKGDPTATLTLELAFSNDKKWPVALSNSGAGVLYVIEFTLQGTKGAVYKPDETAGIVAPGETRQLKPPRVEPFFGEIKKRSSTHASPPPPPPPRVAKVSDVNFRIQPGETAEGRLVFHAPRDNYLLTVERKFAGKPVTGTPTDHVAVCKISAGDTAGSTPIAPVGSGVY